jgi:hypothetical protein
MRSFSLFLFFLAVITHGCGQVENAIQTEAARPPSITGTWRLSNLSQQPARRGGDDKLLQAAKEKELLQQGLMMSFFKDGTFTEVGGSGAYKSGTWKTENDENEVYLVDSNHTDVRSMRFRKKGTRALLILQDEAGVEMEFVLTAPPLADAKDDPFHATNNHWRVKPQRKETLPEIEERLANYFKHLAFILKAAKEGEATTVSFEFSQGIAKIYNGGIGIQPRSFVPRTWQGVFYNNEDANIAYEMFEKYLSRTAYKGASTGAWVEDDYNILLSIYGDVKGGEFRK